MAAEAKRADTTGWACLLGGVLLALTGSRLASGQETREYELPDLDRPPGITDLIQTRLTFANRFVGTQDFGTFESASFQPEGRLRIELPLSKVSVVRLTVGARALVYDWNGVSDLYGTGPTRDDPFDDLISWRARVQAARLLPEHWRLFSEKERWAVLVQGEVRASHEWGSDISAGLAGGGGLGFFYRLGDVLELAAGVTLGSRPLKGGLGVLPFFELDWRPSPRWRIKSYGLGLQLERILSERFRVFARARLEGSRYRLADRGGDVGRGAVRVRQLPVGLGLRWKVSEQLYVSAIAGAILYNQLQVRNARDQTIASFKANPSPYVTVRFDLAP